MKVAVARFLGSNCEEESAAAFRFGFGCEVETVFHDAPALPADAAVVVLPGGFSYGDALRSGALARYARIMPAIRRFVEAGGVVLGICNGFQILLEAGLLPGAMLRNAGRTFVCREVTLDWQPGPFGPASSPDVPGAEHSIVMPVAHGEGRYYASDETVRTLEKQGQIVLRYRENPNGSVANIAGIADADFRVVGLMPHPERAVGATWTGKPFLEAVLRRASEGRSVA